MNKATSNENAPLPSRRVWWLVGISALFWTVYLLGVNRVFGLLIDDAWYLMLSKSLATGQGYQLLNSPSPGIMPFYPPGWPFLLSLGYRLWPSFPNNVLLLKLISITAVYLSGCLTYLFFTKCRGWQWQQALLISSLLIFQTEFYTIATTTLMSEAAFTAWLMLLVYLVARADQQASGSRVWLYVAAAALAGTGLFLTRTMGVAVLAGIFFWWLYRKQWKRAALFTVIIAALALPWMLYARAHEPTASQREEQQGSIVTGYVQHFWEKRAGTAELGQISGRELPMRVGENLFSIATSDIGGILIPALYSAVVEKNEAQASLLAFALFLLVLFGTWVAWRRGATLIEFILAPSLLMILLWGWQPFRFLLPFTAFLFYYLAEAFQHFFNRGRGAEAKKAEKKASSGKPETQWLYAALGLFLLLFVADIAAFLFIPTTPEGTRKAYYQKRFSEIEGALGWMRDLLPDDGAVTTPNPPLVHLYTGRKTVGFNEPAQRWEIWKKINVRYLALIYGLNPLPALTANEKNFRVIYQHPGVLNLRVVDFGVASNRKDWQASATSQSIELNLR